MTKSKNIYQDRVYSRLEGYPILFHPALKEVLGGNLNAAIWLSQILYWHGKGKKSGEIYKSRSVIEKETGLTRDQQIRVEIHVKKLRVVKIVVKPGQPSPINHISVDFEVLDERINNIRGIRTLDERASKAQRPFLKSSIRGHQSTQNTENIPEITQENIQKGVKEQLGNNGTGHQDYLSKRKQLGL